MSKPIRSYPQSDQFKVAKRRIDSNTKGLGYWAAVDFMKRSGKVVVVKEDQK